MERSARRRLLLPGRPRRPHLRLLASHGQQGRSGQPLVPVRRHRRHRHGLLRRRHGRARRWPRRHERQRGGQQLRADVLRPGVHVTRVGARRGRLLFPDRFRNGEKKNDPKTGDVRYADPVLELPWGTLPEGCCRTTRTRTRAARGGSTTRRPTGARLGEARAAATTSAATSRRRRQARLPGRPRDHGRLLQPDLRWGLQPPSTTRPGLLQARSLFRRQGRLGQARQEGGQARHPADPRQRLQPHVLRQPAVRPLQPLQEVRRGV